MFSFGFATRVIISSASVALAATIIPNAVQAGASDALAQLAQVQQMAVASDGTFPDQLGSLENTICADDIADVFGEACDNGGRNFFGIPLDDFATSYVLSADRMHYVVAKQLKDDSVLVISDTITAPITCDAYDYNCLAQLTEDEGLRNSVPDWQSV